MSARRFDLVVFDLDGTLIATDEPIWKTLHERLGSDPLRRREVLRRGIAGTLAYADWVAEDVAMLRAAGATRGAIEAIVDGLDPTPGALELLARLRAGGLKIAVLSGGISLIVSRRLPAGALDAVWINRLHFDAGGALVGGEHTPYDRTGKAAGIAALADGFGVSADRVAFVGNGANDVPAGRAAAFAIAWNDAPPALRQASDVYLAGPDLMDALPFLTGAS